jgi:hypothetical protein
MIKVNPEFETDEYNRVVCRNHDDYIDFINPDKDFFEILYLEKKLTCLTCSHYRYDDCYFTKKRIDEIENKRGKRVFRCALCGKKIDRMFTIVHKIYLNERYRTDVPLICCNCYEYIAENRFLSESKKLMQLYLFIVVALLFFLWLFNFVIFLVELQEIVRSLMIIVYFILNLFIIIKILKRVWYIIKGMRYYKKNYIKINSNK